jgi:quercetin dioxygenase-like cupin family protein
MATVTVQAANIGVTGPPRNGVATVTVEGTLLVGDGDKFQEKTNAVRDAVIVFRSEGGSTVDGIRIGEIIRSKGFSSLVVERCASACALAWLGGRQRFMAAAAQIGFHAARDSSGQQSGVGNALVGAYLRGIGLPYKTVIFITTAPPSSITWLNVANAKQYSIDVTPLDERCSAQCSGNSNAFYVTQTLARLNHAKDPGPAVVQTTQPPPNPNVMVYYTTPLEHEPSRIVRLQSVDLPPHTGDQFHRHPGDQWSVVQEGEVTLTVKGQPPRVVKAGESVYIPRDLIHRYQNLADKSARMIELNILDKDKPAFETVADSLDPSGKREELRQR